MGDGDRKGPSIGTVLLVDDDEIILEVLTRFISALGHEVVTATRCSMAESVLKSRAVDLMILDNRMPDGPGLEFFARIAARRPHLPVIFMTGDGSLETVVAAMRLGAKDYLLKPFTYEAFIQSFKANFPVLQAELSDPRQIAGHSQAMCDVWEQVEAFSPTDITILLLGESGTGKELFARAIHERSSRAGGKFVELDCASLPSSLIESELLGYEKGAFTDAKETRIGKFELADGGTLFLDELGNLSLDNQAKLLQVVQERAFRRIGGRELVRTDLRIIAATNVDLEDAVRRCTFRSDLYFRLAELTLPLPPLRDRTGDVPVLCDVFVSKYSRRYNKSVAGVSTAARQVLENHGWPGNVRELENVIRAAVVHCEGQIEMADICLHLTRGIPRPAPLAAGSTTARADPTADSRTSQELDNIQISVPWGDNPAGLDLKGFMQQVKCKVEGHILQELRRRGLNKAQMARFLNLDYKFLLEKLRAMGDDRDELSR